MNTSQGPDQDAARKPSPFDNLSREDLVKKCKGLLGIAQKAKQVKDECLEENRRLKEQLSHYETQKNADKECIKAMQEVADSYMDQKLQATMKVDELEKQLQKLKTQLIDEQSSHEKNSEKLRANIEELKKELDAFKENATDYTKEATDAAERIKELEEENAKLEKERVAIEQELIKVKGSQTVLGDSVHSTREEKLIRKLKLYKAKVQEINAKLLILKSDRKILLKTVKEYSEQVPKWQKELVNASNVLFDKIRTIELEKSDLEERLSKQVKLSDDLQAENVELNRRLSSFSPGANNSSTTHVEEENGTNLTTVGDVNQIAVMRKQLEDLNAQYVDMEKANQQMLSEYETKLQLERDEKENLRKDLHSQANSELLEKADKRVENLEKEVKVLQEKLEQTTEQVERNSKRQELIENDLKAKEQELESSEKEKLHLASKLEEAGKLAAQLKLEVIELQSSIDTMSEKLVETVQRSADLEEVALKFSEEKVKLEKTTAKLEERKAVMQKLIVENENLEAQLGQLAEKLKNSIAKSNQLEERNKQLEDTLASSRKQLEELDAERIRLSDDLKHAQAQEAQKVEEISLRLNEKCSFIAELQRENEALSEKWNELAVEERQTREANDKEMQQQVKQLEEELASSNGKQDVLKSENAELLSELKEINEILKERGEVINLQVSKIAELQEKLSRVETVDVEPLKHQIENLQRTVDEKDAELERQRDELATIRDRSNISFDAQSDVMSTSTISRVEDVARMREVDESFEEKYIKLRSLAVKLKRKVAEQTVMLQKYEKEASNAAAIVGAVVTTTNPVAVDATAQQQTVNKNLQTLQAENDRLEDRLENLRQEMVTLHEELDRKTVELATMEQLQKDVKETGKDRSTLESAIREYQTQIQNLKREKDAFQLAKREIDAENQRLKASLKSKEKELADEQELQRELKAELDRTKLAVKKANVLSLEMEAYERSLNELNTKLEAKKTLVRELEGTIDVQEQSIKSLKQQLVLLEESLESQQKHSRELKQEADTMQGKLRQSEHQRVELMGQLEELGDEHDRLKQRVENNRVELEQMAADKEQVCGALEVEKSNLLKKNLTLEDELNVLRKAIVEKQQEVEDVRTEFASYKIRAQSVLRQNQSKDSSREKELEEELDQVQRSLEAVEAKQQVLLKQIGDLSKANEELRSERERTQNRCKELLALLEESRLQNESLLEETRKTNLEHQETLKTHRIQNETLIQCYKKQLEELQEAHNRELEQLQTTARHRAEATLDGPSVSVRVNLQNSNSFIPIALAGGRQGGGDRSSFTDEQRVNLLLMEREEGEGSESTSLGTALATSGTAAGTLRRNLSSTSTVRGRSNRDVIPLDELLNSSFEETASVVLGDGEGDQSSSSFFGREPSPTVELQHTKEQLSKQESRVRHLTAVLAEAEQDLAKLTQLNEMLKEEVRRQQRSIEREAHVHNSEYLKNVIFKFITLNNGDERSRLVPVLNTILKLSPEETQKLQNVAKGTDAASRGWTGLLWS
ncbi:GRIP and coiled-coil domain-containing protein 2 [Anopheles ziemanni]|uniref:GRIP and coiled-coil domain-containing protein 2 n=1 Tax=Anopheles coustani TaxID=139045 RepID=UPI00265B18C2|nr:GRIP and coiled-coil domain-containing protein 2 [Anopheles coustani]XP_058175010.1 GRIP and coiled-coil domain-containing protein 2 [Anopheles ziemanni]